VTTVDTHAHMGSSDPGEEFLDQLVATTLAPGSGFVSADGRTEEHAQAANERLWERELRRDHADADSGADGW
jgi:hypothetical protein